MHRLLPPRLFLICALAAWLASERWPVPRLAFAGSTAVAGLVVAAGFAMMMVGWAWFRRRGTEIYTFSQPTLLVVDGPYRFSRNPMYLGFLVMLVGLAVGFGSVAAWVGPLAFFAVASLWYVPFEEARCAQTFGRAYLDYRARVRRWV